MDLTEQYFWGLLAESVSIFWDLKLRDCIYRGGETVGTKRI